MALQALSLYGAVTYAKSGAASKVTLRSGGDFQQDFQVDPTNRLLLQRVALPQVPGEYSTEVSGEGCVYLQVRVLGAGGILRGEPLARQEPGRGQKDRTQGRSGREGSGRGKRRRGAEVCGGERAGGKDPQHGGAVRAGEVGRLGGERTVALLRPACTHTCSHRAAGSSLDKPEVQRAAHTGGRTLPASCVHNPRDMCGLQGSQGL